MSIALPKVVRLKRRRGRGIARGGAKSGRGMKGQKSRAGYHSKAGFEGGQTPLYMRLPKGRGTKQKFRSQVKKPTAISVSALNQFEDGTVVGPGALRKQGLLAARTHAIKLIGTAKMTKKLTVRFHTVTPGAKASIETAGGKVEIIKA